MAQYLTCAFKLHNPSAHKRAVLDYAFTEYTRAYGELLAWAREHEGELAERGKFRDKYTDKSVRALMPPQSSLTRPMHSSLKASLVGDVAGNLASYLALKAGDFKPSFPVGRNPSPDALQIAEADFAACLDTDDYNGLRDALLRQARGSYMPMSFSRADGATAARNFSLLTHQDRDGLYAVLYLLPAKHELCKPVGPLRDTLVRIDTGEVFKSNPTVAILAPLELGENGWQFDKFIDASRQGRARVKSATLVKEEDDYYLHVAFEFETQPAYEPKAYLGIDKGILFSAAYSVVDLEGRVLEMGHLDDDLRALQIKHGQERERRQRNGQVVTKRHFKQKAYENILHSLANRLIDLALKYQAQIVLEDLNIQVKGGRVISRFRKLDGILTYKSVLAGMPKPRQIWAAYSSVICHRCGCKGEREDRDFYCPSCGWRGHADDNASVNIARRPLYRKADWPDYWQFHRGFANLAGLEAKNDLRTDLGQLALAI